MLRKPSLEPSTPTIRHPKDKRHDDDRHVLGRRLRDGVIGLCEGRVAQVEKHGPEAIPDALVYVHEVVLIVNWGRSHVVVDVGVGRRHREGRHHATVARLHVPVPLYHSVLSLHLWSSWIICITIKRVVIME